MLEEDGGGAAGEADNFDAKVRMGDRVSIFIRERFKTNLVS